MTKIFRLTTAHKTGVFADDELRLSQDDRFYPLYVEPTDKLEWRLFLMRDGDRQYISHINDDLTVEIADESTPIKAIENKDGSFTLMVGKKFLSARKAENKFTLVNKNLGWEHFFLTEPNFINVKEQNIFRVRTAHHTKLSMSEGVCMVHRTEPVSTDLPIFAQLSDDELSFFVIKNNAVKYIQAINSAGRIFFQDDRLVIRHGKFHYISAVGRDPNMESLNANPALSFHRNELDNSITVQQNGSYWSAREKGSVSFTFSNLGWEHFSLEPVELLEIDKTNAILFVTDSEALDAALAGLNLDRLKIAAALIDGISQKELEAIEKEKRIATFSFAALERFLLEGQNNAWLLSGNDFARLEKMSEYLQTGGIARSNIINISVKMHITPRLIESFNAAVKDDCDFIVTGDRTSELGLNVNLIVNRRGINFAADDQDLRQSYLIAKRVLESNRKIKFMLIGLTPQMLSARDSFSERGSDIPYIFRADNSSLENKIFEQMINTNSEITADLIEAPTPPPHLQKRTSS